MSTLDHAQRTSSTRPAVARLLALAAAIACVALGLALVARPVTADRAGAVHRTASRRAGVLLDGRQVLRVYDEVDRRARDLPPDERARVARTILEEAARADLAPSLVLAVVLVESSFRHRAASPAGAVGLMQLRPSTMHAELARARVRGADPLDPVANVRAGVRYLGRLVRAFDDLDLALVAYNTGPARLRRHLATGQVPERLLRYARLVREAERAATARGAPAPASRLALAPAHEPGAPHASMRRAAVALWQAAPGRGALPSGWGLPFAWTSRAGAREREPIGALPPPRPSEDGLPCDALAGTPFRSRLRI